MIGAPAAPPAPAPAAPRVAPGAAPAALARVARDFEAQALAALLGPVFETVPADGPFAGGAAERQWRPMLVDAIAKDMARAGGLGIGDAVLRELLRAQERMTAPQGDPG